MGECKGQEEIGGRDVGRQERRKTPSMWDKMLKQEEVELEKWEEVPNSRAWMVTWLLQAYIWTVMAKMLDLTL